MRPRREMELDYGEREQQMLWNQMADNRAAVAVKYEAENEKREKERELAAAQEPARREYRGRMEMGEWKEGTGRWEGGSWMDTTGRGVQVDEGDSDEEAETKEERIREIRERMQREGDVQAESTGIRQVNTEGLLTDDADCRPVSYTHLTLPTNREV